MGSIWGLECFMEIVCPSCGKANQSTPCRRCGGELASLFAVCRAAELELRVAGKCLRSRNLDEAREHAERSWKLRHTPEAARLVFLACLALDDFTSSRLWHRRVAVVPLQNREGIAL
jgi:hypothetical protein